MQKKDTVFHYLWVCTHVQSFWRELENFVKNKCEQCHRLSLSACLVLFGWDSKSKLDEGFRFILLHAKYFVYRCRISEMKPTVPVFLLSLKKIKRIDRYVHQLDMLYDKFYEKWEPYNSLLT